MANQATTTYKVTGTRKAVNDLWSTLQKMEVNSKNIWLYQLAEHYGIDYETKQITPPPKDGSGHMTFGRFAGIFACQGAADRERKKAVKTDGGSEVPLSSRSNNKQLDVRVV